MKNVGSVGEGTFKLIRRSATDLIAEKGYEAMNLRQLAERVGITSGSMYYYIVSKQALLCGLIREVMEDMLDAANEFVLNDQTVTSRLESFIRLHIQFHLDRRNDVLIASTELRSLDARNLGSIIKLRNKYEAILNHIVRKGGDDGVFHCNDTKLATLAILSMLTGVATGYWPVRRLDREQLFTGYIDLTYKLLGVTDRKLGEPTSIPIQNLAEYSRRHRAIGFGATPRR